MERKVNGHLNLNSSRHNIFKIINKYADTAFIFIFIGVKGGGVF